MKALSMLDLFVLFFIAILIHTSANVRLNWPGGPRGRFRP